MAVDKHKSDVDQAMAELYGDSDAITDTTYNQLLSTLASQKIRQLDHLSTQQVETQLMGAESADGLNNAVDDTDNNDNNIDNSMEVAYAEVADEAIAHKVNIDDSESNDQVRTGHLGRDHQRTSSCFITEIDLHYLTVAQSLLTLENKIEDLLIKHRRVKLRVITGRGRHSNNGPQIAQHAHNLVTTKFATQIIKIEACPTASMINNIALKGYFMVEFKGYSG